jgi:hypothetical protein
VPSISKIAAFNIVPLRKEDTGAHRCLPFAQIVYAAFFLGTFAPDFRASESPIAIACLRLFTFLPLRPLFSLPRFIACISRFTDFPAFGLYLRRDDDFFRLLDDFERDERERVDALRRVPRCDERLFELADFLREEPLRELRPRLDFLVAAMRI